MIASQWSSHCDVLSNQLWRHKKNINRVSETRCWCVKIMVLSSFIDSLCRVRDKIMYVLSWWTLYALTRVLFWCLFPSVLRNSGNEKQHNPRVSTETVRHSSRYILLFFLSLQHQLCGNWLMTTKHVLSVGLPTSLMCQCFGWWEKHKSTTSWLKQQNQDNVMASLFVCFISK